MKAYFKNNIRKKAKEITGKDIKNVKIIDKKGYFIADFNSSNDIKSGTQRVNVIIEYTDGTVDELRNQEIIAWTKDIKLSLNYSDIKSVLGAVTSNKLFWLGLPLTFIFGIVLFVIVFGFVLGDKSKYYQKKGPSIMKLTCKYK